ncbi:MAG: hypothetical protein E7137_05445 [Rikenellaceae bacterium]|nr:hypothetical protein [Rikenellaceae bacterium]
MKQNNALRIARFWLNSLVIMAFLAAFTVRCATVNNNLTGGPKDTLPPVIVSMLPDNFSTRYPLVGNNRRIYVEFDEFVQLKDQHKEFYTSPQMKKKPLVTVRGRGIMIQIRDTLLENQTYALNFGSSLRDNNEGNPLHAMRYVFSTGDEVDSMICSGYTADSYKADSVSKSYIWFFAADSLESHPDYDSTLFNHKPAAIARAETNGIFIAQNLKPIPYRVYAIEDTNDNQLYEPGVDQVGFIEQECNPAELPDFAIWYDSIRQYPTADPQLYFRMFTDKAFKRQVLTESSRPSQHQALLYFGAPNPDVRALEFDSIPAERVIYDAQTTGRDTVALWFDMPAEQLPDTIRGRITYFKHDSINQLVETTQELKLSWRYVESKEEQKEREKQERAREKAEAAGEEYQEPEKPNPFGYKLSLTGEVNPEKGLSVDFDYPLVRFDSTAVELTLEEEGKDPKRVPIHFRRDTANMRRWHLDVKWQTASQYKLYIPEGTFTDVAGQQNDSLGGSYTTLDPEKYATVKLTLKPRLKEATYIVQLLNGSGSLQQEKPSKGGTVQFNYVPAGEIKFRVIEDMNGNGKWDTGNVVERRQPERAEYYITPEGEETFATKVNWEIELEMDMNEMFAPVTMQSLIELLEKRELQRLEKEAEKAAEEAKNNKNNHNNSSQGGFGMGGAMGGFGGGMGGFGGGGGMGGFGGGGMRTNSGNNTVVR